MADYIGLGTYDDSDAAANRMVALRVQNTVGTGHITSIRFRVNLGSGNARLGVYADSSGSPGALVADAGAVAVSGANWYAITGLSIDVTDDAYYWLVMLADSAFYFGMTVAKPVTCYWHGETYGALPDPFGTADNTSYYSLAIQAYVEEAAETVISGAGAVATGFASGTAMMKGTIQSEVE